MTSSDYTRTAVDNHRIGPTILEKGESELKTVATPSAVCSSTSSRSKCSCNSQCFREFLGGTVPPIARFIVQRTEFEIAINLTVAINGMLAGLSTYQQLQRALALRCAEYAVLAIFTVDILLRMIVEPWTYWLPHKSRGSFDVLITILFYIPFDEKSRSSVSLLSMLRLVYFSKVVASTPQLRIIVTGMVGGFTAVGYIMFLLLFIYYIYAIIGVCIFQQNNPWYFGNLPTAILTLFRASTLDSWSDIFYIDFYGCQKFDAGIYHMKESNSTVTGSSTNEICAHPKEKPISASLYWISFVIVASFVVMSLFVGSITMSMTESMRQLKREKEEQRARMLREKKVKSLLNDFSISDRRLTFIETRRLSIAERITRFLGLEMTLSEKIAARAKLAQILQQCLKAQEIVVVDTNQGHELDQSYSIIKVYVSLGKVCAQVITHRYFAWFMYCNIILSGILISLETGQNTWTNDFILFRIFGKTLLAVFTIEILLKLMAEGFYPLRFFKSVWNCLDMCIVLGCYFVKDNGWKFTLETLRLLRLLRMTRGFKSLTQFQVIMNALFSGLSSVVFIGLLLVIVIFIYSVLGVFLFGANDPMHFGSLHISSISLFRCATMDSWSSIMYTNIFGCDQYGYEDNSDLCTLPRARGWLAVAYFISYTVMSSLVLLTLFIGVVTTTMEDAQEKQRLYETMEDKIDKFQAERNIKMDEIDRYREAFRILDLNESGNIDLDELRICLKSIGQDPPDVELFSMMKAVDIDESGELDLFEFIKFMATATNEGKVPDKVEIGAASVPTNIYECSQENRVLNDDNIIFCNSGRSLINQWGAKIAPT